MSPTLTTQPVKSLHQQRLDSARERLGPLYAASDLPERAVRAVETMSRPEGSYANTRASAVKAILAGGIVLLYGARTTGKTVMATDIAIELMAAGKATKYVRALELMQDLRRKNNVNDAASAELVRPYRKWPFLIIDELGIRMRGNEKEYSESDAALITTLLDTRYQGMVGTLMISNETAAETFKVLGPSVARRIEQTGFAAEAKWAAFRS